MDDIQRRYLKQFLMLCIGHVIVLCILVFAFIRGTLPPRAFGIVALILNIGIGYGYFVLFRRTNKKLGLRQDSNAVQAVSPHQMVKQIRRLRLIIAFLVFCNLYANWEERGDPLLPRIVGNTVSLLLIWAVATALRNTRARSKHMQPSPSPH